MFLLPGTLQVDLAFVGEAEFRATAPSFRLVAGEAREAQHAGSPDASLLVGYGWLYAMHARSSMARGQLWQAEYMISGLRDQALALACLRHGLSAVHGRGLDRLPAEVAAGFEAALVRRIERAELRRAFAAGVAGLLRENECVEPALAQRLRGPLLSLASGTEE